jgi:hypothetical protein
VNLKGKRMSTFDPESFLDGAIDEPVADRFENPDEGTYQAQIDSKEVTNVTMKDGREQPIFRVMWDLLDDRVRETLGREKVTVRQDIWLDVDPATGALAKGPNKNVSLGKLLTALDLNQPGVRLSQIEGTAMVHVRHRSDKNNPEIKYAEVDRVTKVGR